MSAHLELPHSIWPFKAPRMEMPQSRVRFIGSRELHRDLPKVLDTLEDPNARFVLTIHSKPKAVLIGAEAFRKAAGIFERPAAAFSSRPGAGPRIQQHIHGRFSEAEAAQEDRRRLSFGTTPLPSHSSNQPERNRRPSRSESNVACTPLKERSPRDF